jgi:hypothetical protein
VDARKKSGTEDGTVNDLVGGFTPHARGHSVSNVFSNTNPIPESLWRIRRKGGVVDLVVNGFHPGELEEGTNVSNTSCRQENGLTEVL